MKDTLEMALDAGFLQKSVTIFLCNTEGLKAFEAFIRADERGECAQIAWKMEADETSPIEKAIRARGNT